MQVPDPIPATRRISIALLAAAMSLPGYARELPFTVITAVLEAAPRERLFDGTVEAVNQATVSAQTAGRVAEVFYDVDDYVEAGAPILRFTDVEQQAALGQARAALAEAQARAGQAAEEFRRVAALYESDSASKREYDRALAAREAAEARVAAAQSAVASARQQLDYTLVRAPYAGIVTERHVDVGEAVTVGQPLMSGLSLESLRIVVDLPQQAAAQVRDHAEAYVLTATGRVAGRDVTLFPFAHEASNTFRARVELPAGRYQLYPGMFVKVAFVVGQAQRLLVPTAALQRRNEVTGVYVVGPEGGVRMRQVRVGGAYGERTEVLAGLSAGEQIAADPVAAALYVKTAAAKAGADPADD
ncbi:MAG: efflux RND transporter periplasmic adaptor subunit [Woeseiaceae bacterium]|nr:efflux RND transporter periplasmic adaptor subunit [Woeseiaceae bacterium]